MRAACGPSDYGAVISLQRESGRKKKEGGVRVKREGDVAAAKAQLQRDDKD